MVIRDLRNPRQVEEILLKKGLNSNSAKNKIKLFEKSAEKLLTKGYKEKDLVFARYVPGRVEVLGKHTDYAGGNSLIIAADRGFCIISTPRKDRKIRVISTNTDESVVFDMNGEIKAETGSWTNYPANVVRRVLLNFGEDLKGCDIAFDSDLPQASGMSSSSAFMIAVFFAIADVNELHNHAKYKANINNKIDLAEYLASIENGLTFRDLDGQKGVGTFGGSEDHTAIINCNAGKLAEYSYCPIEFKQEIDLPNDYKFVIASSGVHAVKTGNAMNQYNMASNLVSSIVSLWNSYTKSDFTNLNSILESSDSAVENLRQLIRNHSKNGYTSEELSDRFEQFYSENYEIIPKSIKFLQKGDLDSFGETVDRSQKLTTELLKNQVSETKFLAKSARELGAVAASAFGAGFGGSVWSLVKADECKNYIEQWQAIYQENFPEAFTRSEFFTTEAGQSAFALI